ncbi:MAG TPA: hypothetical protein VIH93_02105 [Thermoanaerobaculia bacterium]|jgi:hypothetical protein
MRTRALLAAALGAAALLALSACTPKYAVLLSSNQVTMDDVAIHSEWWYDLVLQYKMLRESGFKDGHIYVVYGDGHDFATVHPQFDSTAQFGHPITTLPMSKANVKAVFQRVDAAMRKRGYLYVWWMGHGGGGGPDQCDLTMMISNTGESLRDFELKSYIDQVSRYKKRSISIMTCHSGGLVDDFAASGERTVVLASSTCAESSYDAPSTCDGVVQAEFDYVQPNGLRRKDVCGAPVASDGSGDGFVSLLEAQAYDASAMTSSTPQLGDPSSLAAGTVIAKDRP